MNGRLKITWGNHISDNLDDLEITIDDTAVANIPNKFNGFNVVLKDDLEKLDHTFTKSTNLGIDLHVYRMGGVVKALYAAGTHTTNWTADTAYGLGTFGGVYAPKISWSKRIIYKYVSGSPHFAVLSMDSNGVITITPETVSYGGTMRIFETYF